MLAAALKSAAAQAQQVLALRDQALQTRQAVLKKRANQPAGARLATRAPAPALPPAAQAFVAAFGGLPSAGILVAEGDSWFDYPGTDILKQLENQHGFEVESVTHRGDPVEAMAYEGGQLQAFARTLENVLLRRGVLPRAILLSGGGNDVAGTDFHVLLNHAESAAPGLNETIVRGLIEERLQAAYVNILATVTHICVARTGQPLPILLHGYDYPVPDGRGFWGGWGPLPGPWLAPGFEQKGYHDLVQRKALIRQLIDAFNVMLAEVVARPEFAHVQYVDLRGTLPTDGAYRNWWANELHPSPKGFGRVADRFAALLVPA
ncbi:hypothetical protein [Hymenobacter sp. PAMC 26628]|uniref:hypothetical protein n=1 Tax=Hymenobacter sp. PAMC 26628 TaxID=1484118 RepID=UPI000770629B|nr:hypothetical protein [Hymenobacter sp. PAMC 26628]AMJ67661.1 hypothetical protein AXW84_21260 [Hymenobacter sp. PAMC 26628]